MSRSSSLPGKSSGRRKLKPGAVQEKGTQAGDAESKATAGLSCSDVSSECWISNKEARRIIGEAASVISDRELSALLAQLYVIAGTAIDITIGDIDHMFEQGLAK